MRGKTKGFLWLGGAFCAAGVLVCTITFMLGGFDFMNVATADKYEPKTENVSPEGLSGIAIDAEDMPLVLRLGTGPDIVVRYSVTKDDTCTIRVENGVLSVAYRSERPWYANVFGLFSGIARSMQKIVVEIPAAYAGEVKAATTNASLKAESLPALSAGTFQTTNGSVTLKNLKADSLSVSTTNASLTLDTVEAKEAAATSTNGRLKLADVAAAGGLYARTTNASLTAERVEASAADVATTNGGLHLTDVQVAGALKGETSNAAVKLARVAAASAKLATKSGNVSLEDCAFSERTEARTTNASVSVSRLASPDIQLESTNGSIKGALVGRMEEYSIVTNTTNASASPMSVIREQAACRLSAVTSNARIALEFVE